jgi:hypothetical protein
MAPHDVGDRPSMRFSFDLNLFGVFRFCRRACGAAVDFIYFVYRFHVILASAQISFVLPYCRLALFSPLAFEVVDIYD